jgi:hypothetical protein
MPYLVLGIAVIIGLVLVIRGLAATDPKRAIKVVKGIVIVLVVVLALFFAFSRGIGAALVTAAFLLPVFLRWRGVSSFARNFRGPKAGQTSDVKTRYLRMSLDHDTGVLDGTVLEGQFRGSLLQEMALSELLELLRECRVNDPQSGAVLESYIDRIHGAEWRRGDEGQTGQRGPGPQPGGGTMTREEAYQVLGLQPGASPEDIKDAHHKLMLKNHPDQGGSTYIATKINQAKELLLGN